MTNVCAFMIYLLIAGSVDPSQIAALNKRTRKTGRESLSMLLMLIALQYSLNIKSNTYVPEFRLNKICNPRICGKRNTKQVVRPPVETPVLRCAQVGRVSTARVY